MGVDHEGDRGRDQEGRDRDDEATAQLADVLDERHGVGRRSRRPVAKAESEGHAGGRCRRSVHARVVGHDMGQGADTPIGRRTRPCPLRPATVGAVAVAAPRAAVRWPRGRRPPRRRRAHRPPWTSRARRPDGRGRPTGTGRPGPPRGWGADRERRPGRHSRAGYGSGAGRPTRRPIGVPPGGASRVRGRSRRPPGGPAVWRG